MYDVGTNDASPYIVTEFLEGQTLRDKLVSRPFDRTSDRLRDAIEVVIHLHVIIDVDATGLPFREFESRRDYRRAVNVSRSSGIVVSHERSG